jgi:hypothetical protein
MNRWRTCLHEAGHVVAARVLLKDAGAAAVVLDAGGLAYIDVPDLLLTCDHALAVAAGPAAESLADVYTPPTEAPDPAAVVSGDAPASKSLHASFAADLRAGASDAVRLARWCCERCPNEPDRWARRHVWITHEAGFFVRNHAQEIASIATRLYARGIVLSDRPKPGKENVNHGNDTDRC